MNKKWIIGGVTCAAGSVLLLIAALHPELMSVRDHGGEAPPLTTAVPATAAPNPTPPPYQSPIDFDALHERNPDIIAWMDIPNTPVQYPIVMRDGDDSFYMNHDSDGNYFIGGALFVESCYNASDFSDPATAIYGHRMNDDTIFGPLQPTYSNGDRFQEANEVIIYLPKEELHYQVFAAVPYDKRHILYNYDFSDPAQYKAFLDSISAVRAIGAQFAEDQMPDEDDRLLILSTCLQGDRSCRFLVLAKTSDPIQCEN